MPPGWRTASAPCVMALAVASAIASTAAASPCAWWIWAGFSPSERAMAASRSPVAMLICSWRRPSDASISARFSRSAVICACMERRIALGGVKSLLS
ncbi:hypothetical protein G6F59_018454 [Rhizopus arrhizus]|nr:hypothetical protein G6F59_018454 [Rhizopus arrhizus]